MTRPLRLLQLVLAVVALVVVLSLGAGEAFVAQGRPLLPSFGVAPRGQAQLVARAVGASSQKVQGPAFAATGAFGLSGVAALLLIASVRNQPRRGGANSATKGRRAAVVCSASLTPLANVPASTPATQQSGPAQEIQAIQWAQLIPISDETPCAMQVPMPAPQPVGRVTAVVVEAESAVKSHAATVFVPDVASARRPAPALFAGGARHSQRRARRASSSAASASARAARAARRAAGARLCASAERVEAEPMVRAFDSSILRRQIQTGLRVPACVRTDRARELKAAADAKNCGFVSGVYTQSLGFLDKERRACFDIHHEHVTAGPSCIRVT